VVTRKSVGAKAVVGAIPALQYHAMHANMSNTLESLRNELHESKKDVAAQVKAATIYSNALPVTARPKAKIQCPLPGCTVIVQEGNLAAHMNKMHNVHPPAQYSEGAGSRDQQSKGQRKSQSRKSK
jgi:hypothetical protein